MSREIRRVSIDYRHPVMLNSLWREHQYGRTHVYTGPKMLEHNERFVPLYEYNVFKDLMDDYNKWEHSILDRSGDDWDFYYQKHIQGKMPFEIDEEDIMKDDSIDVRDEDHLQELLLSDKSMYIQKPYFHPDVYMPSFEEYDQEELGYCLYETVSNGTPITPVFATSEALAKHLVEYGTRIDPPLSESAAKAIVVNGYTAGSAFVVNDTIHHSLSDADKILKKEDS